MTTGTIFAPSSIGACNIEEDVESLGISRGTGNEILQQRESKPGGAQAGLHMQSKYM